MLKKGLEFKSNKKNNIDVFNLRLMVLLIEVNLMPEKQSYKKNVLGVRGTGHVKIVFALLTKVVVFHRGITIIQVRILSLDGPIPRYNVCFTMFLALNTWF